MSILFTDNFNRDDGGLGGNYSTVSGDGSLTIFGNQLGWPGGGINVDYNNTVSWPNNQYAQLVMTTPSTTTDEGFGPAIRVNAGGDMYFAQSNTHEIRLYKRVSGSFTQLGSDGPAVAANDVIYIQANGTSLLVKQNGTTVIGPVTDSGVSSGSAGIWLATGDTNSRADDFEGGDISSAFQPDEDLWLPPFYVPENPSRLIFS